MSSIKKLASQTAIYGLSSIVGRLINYLLIPIYVRTLSVFDNGVLTDFYANVTFLIVVYTVGMETTFFRFANKGDLKQGSVYTNSLSVVLFTSLLLSGLFILLAQPIASWMMYPEHPEYIICFALILALDAVTAIPFVRLRQQNRPIRFVTGKLLNIGVNVFFNLYFLVLCPWLEKHYPGNLFSSFYRPDIGVGYVFLSNLISMIITAAFLGKELKEGFGKPDKRMIKEMLLYSIPIMIAGLAGMTNESFSRIILKYELPYSIEENIRQLGIFGQCFKLSVFMSLAIQTFRMAAEPFFFSYYKQENSKEMYARVMDYFVIVCCFIFLSVALYLDLLKHMLRPAYYEGLIVVPFLLMAYLFLGIYQNLSIWFKLADKTRFGIYFTVFGAIITIALNYLLIPTYGYTGSAVATLICYFLMALLCYLVGQRYYTVPYKIKRILGYLAFALILYAAGNYIRLYVFKAGSLAWFMAMAVLIGIFVTVTFLIEKQNLKKQHVKSPDN